MTFRHEAIRELYTDVVYIDDAIGAFDKDNKKVTLDEDKINDLAKCLFTLNNRRYGPIPGAYMVICTKPEKEWCVAQLNADRAKPFIIFEDKAFNSIDAAQKEAEKIKKERGESAPRRCT